jgi:iron complex outermembrane receptor protein
VLIVEDGLRMGDLSSQSGDHGVNVNPATVDSIEVVRGPATLLYGANAIGGLVNVVTNEIPPRSTPPELHRAWRDA